MGIRAISGDGNARKYLPGGAPWASNGGKTMADAVRIFISYAHEDDALRERLRAH